MKKIALAALCSTALISAASAADLASAPAYTKAAPIAVAQVYNWTGFYIGGNVGYAHNNIKANDSSVGIDPVGAALVGVDSLPMSDTSSNGSGFTGGGQIGYNFQIGQTVLGVEGDFNYINAKQQNALPPVDTGALAGVNVTDSIKSDWFATARGRIGYSFGAFMPYITGGVAFMHTTASLSAAGNIGTGPGNPVVALNYNASADKTLVGYAVGVGGEYALDRNWSIKGEYLHMGFGGQDYDATANVNVDTVGSFAATTHSHVKMDYDIARLGLNYRF